MKQERNRAGLLGIAGAYLLYLAWQLFQGRNNPDSSMPRAVLGLFIGIFGIAACALFVMSWKLWQKAADKEKEEREETSKEDSDSLK